MQAINIRVSLTVVCVLVTLLGISPLPHRFTQDLKHAQEHVVLREYLDAALAYAQAARMLPWRVDLWEAAAHFALQGGNPQMAVDYLKPITQKNLLSLDGTLDLAEAYHQISDLKAAIQTWHKSVELGADPIQLYPQVLRVQLCEGDYQGSIDTLKRLVELQPKIAKWQYQLGMILATQEPILSLPYLAEAVKIEERFSDASQKVSHAITLKSASKELASLLLESGRSLAALEEWLLAAEAFHQATIHRPDFAEAWAFYGEALQHFNQNLWSDTGEDQSLLISSKCVFWGENENMIKRSSLEALQKALEIDPESLPANVFLALNYQRQNQYEEALHYLNKAASLDTHNSAIQVELGNTYALSGDLASAIYAYRRAVTQSPNTPIFLKMLLQFQINYRYKLEDWDLNAVREVMSKYPNDVILIDLLGQLLSQIEEEAMAEDYFKQVLELDSSYAPVYLHLGELYLQIGKIQKAQEYLSKANEIAPASNASEQAQYLMQIYLP